MSHDMKHRRLNVSLLGILAGIATSTAVQGAETVTVGTTPELFVDNHLVETLDGLKRVVQQPQRVSRHPILTAEHPWEGRVLQMPCVLWDPLQKIFHMYYWAAGKNVTYTCYARSKDGTKWKKPTLGLHTGPGGSKQNNIVLRGTGRVARTRYVVLNPRTDDPQRRFLALYIDNVPGLTEFAASSPDGLHWKTEKTIGDLRHVRGGHTSSNPPFFLIEQQWGTDPGDGHRYRAIWRTESRDMKTWTGGRLVIERLADDDPNLEFYHACSHFLGTSTYRGMHLGYLYLFHSSPTKGVRPDGVRLEGTVDTALISSRDTIHWTRVDRRRRFLPLGPAGSWDAGMNYVAPEVIVGRRMHFYYSGWKFTHGATNNSASIGLATLPLDRIVSIEPVTTRGAMTTRLMKFQGERLEVNVDADDGHLKVEVLDEAGQVIPGFDVGACRTISSDSPHRRVRWRRQKLKQLAGQPIRLRFHLAEDCRLFGFRCR